MLRMRDPAGGGACLFQCCLKAKVVINLELDTVLGI